jgi:EmrB/QacA subfamily drug resistance transporter
LTGLVLVVVLSSLDQSMVATALPRIASDLGDVSYIPWIVTAFMMTSTVATPVYGKLSDIYGRRRLLVVGIIIFLAASALCGSARDTLQLVICRAAQGFGAGGLVTLAQSALSDLVGPRQRGRYQALFSTATSVSSVVGPLVAGLLLAVASWRWVFLASLPVGIIAIGLNFAALPSARGRREHQIDWVGVIYWIVAAASVLLFLSAVGTTRASSGTYLLVTCAAAIIFVVLFLRRESRAREPILSLNLFRIPSFAIAVTAAALMTFAMQAATVFLPLYFQIVLLQRPEIAGLMLLPQVAGMIMSATIGGRMSAHSGAFKRYLVTGVSFEAMALTLLVLCALTNAGPGSFMVALFWTGAGDRHGHAERHCDCSECDTARDDRRCHGHNVKCALIGRFLGRRAVRMCDADLAQIGGRYSSRFAAWRPSDQHRRCLEFRLRCDHDVRGSADLYEVAERASLASRCRGQDRPA